MLQDAAIIAIVLVIVVAVASHLVRARKRGEHCIGCPYAGEPAAQASPAHSTPKIRSGASKDPALSADCFQRALFFFHLKREKPNQVFGFSLFSVRAGPLLVQIPCGSPRPPPSTRLKGACRRVEAFKQRQLRCQPSQPGRSRPRPSRARSPPALQAFRR